MRARFYGMCTPGCADSTLGWTGAQAITVEMGPVLLARTAKDPDKVFIIQIVGQDPAQEQVSAWYSVIGR